MPQKKCGSVLVVDDHADTLRILLQLLAMNGYTAHGAGTVREAVDVAHRENCGLLVTDLGLPDGSGVDLLVLLRTERATKGIAVTGHDDGNTAAETRAAGFSAHLVKPVMFADLLKAIELAYK